MTQRLLIAMLAAACSRTPAIMQVTVSDSDMSLELYLGSCNADPEVDVVETDQAVTLLVGPVSKDIFFGRSCQDRWIVELDQPLGDRAVRDGNTGEDLLVLVPIYDHESS